MSDHITVKANKQLQPALECQQRYLGLYGGAGSGKSYIAIQKKLIRIVKEKNHRFLFLRKHKIDVRESIYNLTKTISKEWGIHLTEQKTILSLKFPLYDSEIITAGLDDVDRLKSISGITGIFIEECDQLDEGDFDQLDLRLRGNVANYNQIVFCWNPVSELHWLKAKFFDKEVPQALLMHSTYKDNTFLDDAYKRTLESQFIDNTNLYRIYVKGEWGKVQTGYEFYQNFDDVIHVKSCMINKKLPIHFGVDYNVVPYMPGAVWQIVERDNLVIFRMLHEYAFKDPLNSIEYVCEQFINDYQRHFGPGLYLYDDATGHRNIPQKDVKPNRKVFTAEFDQFNYETRFHKNNPSVIGRRRLINTILNSHKTGKTRYRIEIDKSCTHAIYDFVNTKLDANGKKAKNKDRKTGADKFGHFSDIADYVITKAITYYDSGGSGIMSPRGS